MLLARFPHFSAVSTSQPWCSVKLRERARICESQRACCVVDGGMAEQHLEHAPIAQPKRRGSTQHTHVSTRAQRAPRPRRLAVFGRSARRGRACTVPTGLRLPACARRNRRRNLFTSLPPLPPSPVQTTLLSKAMHVLAGPTTLPAPRDSAASPRATSWMGARRGEGRVAGGLSCKSERSEPKIGRVL